MAYHLSLAAAADIRSIFSEGMRRFGKSQAAKYHLYLESVFETIAANPRIARERPELQPPMRVHSCGSHIVLYLVEASNDVLIVRVRHHREDWKPR